MTEMDKSQAALPDAQPTDAAASEAIAKALASLPPEVGGAPGPEPTRYGDWAHKGRCTDF
jgi:hypothetical protein